jgi:hypothetical protein
VFIRMFLLMLTILISCILFKYNNVAFYARDFQNIFSWYQWCFCIDCQFPDVGSVSSQICKNMPNSLISVHPHITTQETKNRFSWSCSFWSLTKICNTFHFWLKSGTFYMCLIQPMTDTAVGDTHRGPKVYLILVCCTSWTVHENTPVDYMASSYPTVQPRFNDSFYQRPAVAVSKQHCPAVTSVQSASKHHCHVD